MHYTDAITAGAWPTIERCFAENKVKDEWDPILQACTLDDRGVLDWEACRSLGVTQSDLDVN